MYSQAENHHSPSTQYIGCRPEKPTRKFPQSKARTLTPQRLLGSVTLCGTDSDVCASYDDPYGNSPFLDINAVYMIRDSA